jgi:hypothetical protein
MKIEGLNFKAWKICVIRELADMWHKLDQNKDAEKKKAIDKIFNVIDYVQSPKAPVFTDIVKLLLFLERQDLLPDRKTFSKWCEN